MSLAIDIWWIKYKLGGGIAVWSWLSGEASVVKTQSSIWPCSRCWWRAEKHPWLTRKWNRFVQKPCEIPQEAFTSSHSGVSLFTHCSAAFLQISLHEFPQLMNTYVGRTGDPSHTRHRRKAWTDLSQHFITPRFTSLISPKTRMEPMYGEDKQSLRWHLGSGQRPKGQSNFQPRPNQKSIDSLPAPPPPESSSTLFVC